MLRLLPELPSDKCTPASSLVARQNDANMRIVAGSTTLPEGNIVYPISFTLTDFRDPTPTVHCSNSTSYDVSVTIYYTWSCGTHDPDQGSWDYTTRNTQYRRDIPAGASFDDNEFTDYAQQPSGYDSTSVTAHRLTVTILRPHIATFTKENIIPEV